MRISVVVAIDPGVRKGGIAIYVNGVLVHACTVHGKTPQDWVDQTIAEVLRLQVDGPWSITWVIEKMVHRDQADQKFEDLERVEASVYRLVDVIRSRSPLRGKVVRLKPEKWKRQVPKPICHKRTRDILHAEEKATIQDQGHDALDAVGMGLVYVGRAKPGIV